MSSVSGPSPIKRRRRSRAQIREIEQAIYEAAADLQPVSLRGLFYALTVKGVVGKTEAEYKSTVGRLAVKMRREGILPYGWIVDGTRWMRKPNTFSSVEQALAATARTYRRALWDDSPVYPEVWVEKEALAGVLLDVTHDWDVPLMVTRGYPSVSFLHSAAETIQVRSEQGQRTCIYYFGDHDPSGRDIDRAIRDGIGESLTALDAGTYNDHADFERLAVTATQIESWELPTRPTKKTDSRARNHHGPSVELDAIPADRLRELARAAIERHVDHRQLEVLRTYEAEERQGLAQLADGGLDR